MKLNILSKPTQPDDVLRYDYSQIPDADERAVVISAAMAIKPMMRRAAEDLVRIGHELIAVKDYLPHGQFGIWLETEFDLHSRTARRMMAVAERLGHKMDTLSVLAPSILYELAADSTPNDVIKRVEDMVAAGEPVTTREVRSMVRPAPAPLPAPQPAKVVYIQPDAAPATNGYHATEPVRETLSATETQALIGRVLDKDFASDTERLAFLDSAGPDAYVHAMRPDRYINSETFDAARRAIRKEVAKRLADEQAKAEALDRAVAEAFAKRQEEARVAAVRHDKQTMLYGLTRALAELPEAAEDTYYDLTGTTLYSAARQAIANAIKELEKTMEAKRV